MPRRSHEQDKAGEPPEDRRCTGTVQGHRKGGARRCTQWTIAGQDTCPAHSPDRTNHPTRTPPDDRRCHGKAKDADGKRTLNCKLWSMPGLTVCYRHGGCNKVTKAAGDRRVAEDKLQRKARSLATLFDVVPVDNPLTALAQHIGEEILFKEILAGFVKDLNADDIRYTDARGSEQLRSEIVVYERALGRVGDRLVAYAKLGIDERLVKIEEDKAALVMGAINAVIRHFGATGQDAADARRIAARHLKVVAEAG